MSRNEWWRSAVIYQIYPRSFADANGDGIGDLDGITRRLDYLGPDGLGVDAIWLSPIFASPQRDFGYDVSDYCAVAPEYGDLAAFDRLVAAAQARGIRVLLDFVPNHTSTEHPWFEASRDPDDPHREWFFWRPSPAGSPDAPPNNWASMFGGVAWHRDPDGRSDDWYMASFLPEQADVNWRTPALRDAMLDQMRFWLDRGVAGFRLDVVDRIMKDPGLRDEPHKPGTEALAEQFPWLALEHVYTENTPDVSEALAWIRAMADTYDGDRVLIGECFPRTAEQMQALYGTPDAPGLQLSFDFNRSLIDVHWDAAAWAGTIANREAELPADAWPSWVLSNHDRSRHASRLDPGGTHPARAKAAASVLLTLRGTAVLYYGEELGMRDVEISPADVQDPVGVTFPGFGRDPARTPMRWNGDAEVGFCPDGVTPWLTPGPALDGVDVAAQLADPESILSHYRRLIALRRNRPSLTAGTWAPVEAAADVLAWVRTDPDSGERTGIAVNFADGDRPLPEAFAATTVLSDSATPAVGTPAPSVLSPDQALVVDCTTG